MCQLSTGAARASSEKKISQPPLPGENVTTFEVTPDGGHVVYRSGQSYWVVQSSPGDVFVAPIDGGPSTLVSGTVGRSDWVSDFYVGLDGMTIMLDIGRQQSSSTSSHLYRASATGGQPVLALSNAGNREDYGFSPNGASWLYQSNSTVRAYSLADGSVRDIATIPSGKTWSLFMPQAVSPDGALIGYTSTSTRIDYRGELWVAPIAGGDAVAVSGGQTMNRLGQSEAAFRFTPESANVVFASGDKLFVNAVTGGTPLQLNSPPTSYISSVYNAVVSTDGTRVFYMADEIVDNRYDLYSVPIAGGPRTTLWTGQNIMVANGLAVTADNVVVFRTQALGSTSGGTLYQVTTGSTAPTFTDPSTTPYAAAVSVSVMNHLLSSDGRLVVYELGSPIAGSNDPAIGAYVTAIGLQPIRITPVSSTSPYVIGAKLTPDGQKLVYRRQNPDTGAAELYVTGVPVTWIAAGQNVGGEVNGGVGFTGGIGFQFTGETSDGYFQGQFMPEDVLPEPTFIDPGESTQVWKTRFYGLFIPPGSTTLTLTYDQDALAPGLNEDMLELYRFTSGEWRRWAVLDRDADANTITTSITFPNAIFALGIDHLLAGDANNDGIVDAADYLAVESNFGATGDGSGLLLGDANDDGRVDGADLLWIERHFGQVYEPTPIPEPGALALLLVGMTLAARRPVIGG